MTDGETQPEDTQPEGTDPAGGSGKADPTGVEGANPALDDTGNLKAAEVGEAPEAPENLQDLDLGPTGRADEPARQEDPDNPAQPETD